MSSITRRDLLAAAAGVAGATALGHASKLLGAEPSTSPAFSPGVGLGRSGAGQPYNPEAPLPQTHAGATGSAVKGGLLPPITPIWDLHLRDTVICLGGDGNYYMSGSIGADIWSFNDGVEL